MVNIQSLVGAGKNKGSYVEVSNLWTSSRQIIFQRAQERIKRKASHRRLLKQCNGNASFNQAFLFLAQPGVQACEVSVKQRNAQCNEYGKLTIGLEQQKQWRT